MMGGLEDGMTGWRLTMRGWRRVMTPERHLYVRFCLCVRCSPPHTGTAQASVFPAVRRPPQHCSPLFPFPIPSSHRCVSVPPPLLPFPLTPYPPLLRAQRPPFCDQSRGAFLLCTFPLHCTFPLSWALLPLSPTPPHLHPPPPSHPTSPHSTSLYAVPALMASPLMVVRRRRR